jgi:hypothetical protein
MGEWWAETEESFYIPLPSIHANTTETEPRKGFILARTEERVTVGEKDLSQKHNSHSTSLSLFYSYTLLVLQQTEERLSLIFPDLRPSALVYYPIVLQTSSQVSLSLHHHHLITIILDTVSMPTLQI